MGVRGGFKLLVVGIASGMSYALLLAEGLSFGSARRSALHIAEKIIATSKMTDVPLHVNNQLCNSPIEMDQYYLHGASNSVLRLAMMFSIKEYSSKYELYSIPEP